MLPDTNYRQLAESVTRDRGSTLQTRFADHGGLAERPYGWRRINSGSEYSRHHTRQKRICPLLFAAETTKAPVVPTLPGLFSLQSFMSTVLENFIFRRHYAALSATNWMMPVL
jgi:hypothetical protein